MRTLEGQILNTDQDSRGSSPPGVFWNKATRSFISGEQGIFWGLI